MTYSTNFKRKDICYIFLICLIFFIIYSAVFIIKGDIVWGSETDWINQHFAIPEYLRTRFYNTGEFFPDFAPNLGGGQNICYIAYYGLFNPIFLPSYLMPKVTMAEYIMFVSPLIVVISAIMCYFLMKRHFCGNLPFILAVMFMCAAPVIFHSHRHIMFIGYLPFLFAALLAAGGKNNIGSKLVLIVSSFCILCTSFYFSISSFAAVIIYAAWRRKQNQQNISLKQLLLLSMREIVCIFIGFLCAGILWVPTLYSLLSGREKSHSFINFLKLFIPTVNADYLLYGAYSAGMTAVSVIAIIAVLRYGTKASRLLAAFFSAVCCLPIVLYLCNGTMYINPKVLIPFLPLLTIICGEFFVIMSRRRINPLPLALISGIIIAAEAIFNDISLKILIIMLIDFAVLLIFIGLHRKEGRSAFVVIPPLLASFALCIYVNLNEHYTSKASLDTVYSSDIQELADEALAADTDFFRFANDSCERLTVNRIYGSDYYTSTIYSSASNAELRGFRDETGNIQYRSAAVISQPNSLLFNTETGCRYRISADEDPMYGEILINQCGDYYLFRNQNALPVGYASSSLMSEEQYYSLGDAERAEALLKNIITPETSENTVNPCSCRKLADEYTLSGNVSPISEIDGAYKISADKEFAVTASLSTPVEGELILLKFHADNRIGAADSRSDISITVNGITNTLSAPDWKYHNLNYDFMYIISSDKPLSSLELEFSKGNYILSDFEAYAINAQVLKEAQSGKDAFVIDRGSMGGDVISGSISVSADGWFNLSVPFDEGFNIYVDGKKVEYFKTNTAFIGFPIAAGSHKIEIHFRSPFKWAGVLISIIGIGLAAACIAGSARRVRSRIRARPCTVHETERKEFTYEYI